MGRRLVRSNGRPPGFGRALIRILIPILSIEGVRVPLTMTFISDASLTAPQIVLLIVAANVCAWIPVLLTLTARRENGFATVWDFVTGTRVVVKPKGTVRPSIAPAPGPERPAEGADAIGPYRVLHEMVPGEWIVATDPVLRRRVWLLRRTSSGPTLARRTVARSGRLRWLQTVETGEINWDAFEAPPGVPFTSLVKDGKRVLWGTLRHWLHDLASELWEATGDQSLPAHLSLDHVWITTDGRAILLDQPWPVVDAPAERIPIGDVVGQQRFLSHVAACVDSTSLALHARPVLQNLESGKFEKLSFLTGTLRGLLERPAEVSKGIRAGSMFMLPVYVWILVFVGTYAGGANPESSVPVHDLVIQSAMLVLGAIALIQLLEFPFRSTASHSIFRLAVINARGEPATIPHLLLRWAIVWVPLILPMSVVAMLLPQAGGIAFVSNLVLLLLWVGAAIYAVVHPHRGLHDRLADTWVVRR
jgi:hypothetical protein